jgi:Allene oxide cyclase barrel like domain
VRTRFGRYVMVLAIVVLGMLISGTGVASANGKGKRPLRITATQIESQFLDLGTPGPSLGDELVFSERLFRHHHEVGESGVVCTVTDAPPPYDVLTFHCVATLRLKSGQITLQGLIEAQGMDDPGPFVVAITGGTGAFNGAGGTAVVRHPTPTTAIYKLFFTSNKKKHHHHGRH